MHRGEVATKNNDFTEAAVQFERAAWVYEYLSDPLAAAEAALELGRCLLYLNHGDLIPALAGRIENLAREGFADLPAGGLITMRVWAAVLRRGQSEPGPFLHLLRLRRSIRRSAAPQPPRPISGGLPLIDFIPPLSKANKARQRGGILRETALLKFRWVPNIRKILQYVAEALYRGAGAQPLDPTLLGESVIRAKLRAMGEELRHLQGCAEEIMDILRWQDSLKELALGAADRRLCEWAEEQRREIMKLAVRFERRVGPAPVVESPEPDAPE